MESPLPLYNNLLSFIFNALSSPLAVIPWKSHQQPRPIYRDSKVMGLGCNQDTDIFKTAQGF